MEIRLVLLCFYWVVFATSVELSSIADDLVELGREQYIRLNEKTKVQKYGECWRRAVSNLHDGCRQLTEETQTVIALRFTDCFLKTSSHETCNCFEFEGVRRRECMQSMSDRAFNSYTEFYTHTQNICFYLKSQIWHEETEDTISRLSFASDKAANQLEELVDSSLNLKQALIDSHINLKTMMVEFEHAALQQQRLLFDVFDRLSSLQEWAIGEISWLDTVIFYLCGVIISHILTATPRTQSARFFLFIAFTINIIAERYVCQFFIDNKTDNISNINETLSWWIWMSRKTLITVCVFILAIAVTKYQDYNFINHNLLVKIQEQNQKLMGYLEKVKMLESSVTSNFPEETTVDIDSDCEIIGEYSYLNQEHQDVMTTPSKLFPNPKSTAAVLRKTEQVIQNALESSFHQFDIVPRHSRSSSPALSTINTRSSTSAESQKRRRKLNYSKENVKSRYNLRYVKEEESEG